MSMQKRYLRKFNAAILAIIMLFGSVTSAYAAEDSEVYEDESVKIETQKINDTETIVTYDFVDSDEDDFILHIYGIGTENYYSKTYDYEGNLLNEVIKDEDKFIAYNADGEILAETTGLENENVESQIMPMYTWTTEPGPVSGSSFINDFSISTIISILSGDIFSITGGVVQPESLLTIAQNAINAYTNRIFYFGFAQYGWDYGFSIVRVELDFYAFSNYTGFLGSYDKIIPNHG